MLCDSNCLNLTNGDTGLFLAGLGGAVGELFGCVDDEGAEGVEGEGLKPAFPTEYFIN